MRLALFDKLIAGITENFVVPVAANEFGPVPAPMASCYPWQDLPAGLDKPALLKAHCEARLQIEVSCTRAAWSSTSLPITGFAGSGRVRMPRSTQPDSVAIFFVRPDARSPNPLCPQIPLSDLL